MSNYQYYGLFLTKKSRNKLLTEFLKHICGLNIILQDIVMYLDHCTLLHSSQEEQFTKTKQTLDGCIIGGIDFTDLEINGFGYNDTAIAFRVKDLYLCANKTAHITILTYNGGKPVDSNSITNWKDIEPIIVQTTLKKYNEKSIIC